MYLEQEYLGTWLVGRLQHENCEASEVIFAVFIVVIVCLFACLFVSLFVCFNCSFVLLFLVFVCWMSCVLL